MADIEDAWRRLEAAARAEDAQRIADLFDADPGRLARLTLETCGLYLDLSKQPWSAAGLAAALDLAEAAGLQAARARLFAGAAINGSEGRAVLHMALRAAPGAAYAALGQPVSAEVEATRAAMAAFAEGVRGGAVRGATGETFNAVVHIGIGGSDLGPRLVWEALKPPDPAIDLRFAANVDGAEIAAALHGLDPARTLVIAVSKTFTTQETLANAELAKAWLAESLSPRRMVRHLIGVTAAPEKAKDWGCGQTFGFRDWVGGRYSLWSAVGLSCAVGLGWPVFEAILAGARAMDAHFLEAPAGRNAPVLLALAHIYNRNALGRGARAVIPYARRMALLPAFLQQLEMESNGKSATLAGEPVSQATASVVFGEVGTNSQHAFFQLLHQGVDVVPVDFVALARANEGPPGFHARLMANAVAQAEALMTGRPAAPGADALARQKSYPGDRPSSFLLLDRLGPETLGALIALFEHKVFVEGVIWGINSFDQWGVELGKSLAATVLAELEGGGRQPHDPSTKALIERLTSSQTPAGLV